MSKIERQIETLPVGDLRLAKRNARTHSKKQIAQICRSIERFGFTNPILIDDDGRVVAGHGRLAAAKKLGLQSVPCLRLRDMSEADKRAYIIADNKLALNAGWDMEILAEELGQLVELDFDVSMIGFDQPEVDTILSLAADASPKPTGPEDTCPELPNPDLVVTRLGDLWTLGRHHLLCGDAKDQEMVSRVMGGCVADMVFTDPPYNVPIDGHVSGLGRTKHREFTEASGELSIAQFTSFLAASFEAIERACKNGAIVYTCMDWRHLREVLDAGHSVFNELKNICVWSKTNGGMGTFYRSQHELVLVWKVGDQPHTNNFGLGDKGRYRTNVWSYPGVNSFGAERMQELASHPTVKPVALVADAIRDVSNRGEIVLDTFGGSGTTLIAAEKTGRCARLVEIDPAYCDVIVRRWQRLTGKSANLTGSDRSFEDAKAERHTQATSQLAEASA
jgi:DNA modification methylase